MAIAANSPRSRRVGQGRGSLKGVSLPGNIVVPGGPAAHSHASQGCCPLPPAAAAAAAIETPAVHTGLKLNTHAGLRPSRDLLAASVAMATCLGALAWGYSLHGGAPGGRALLRGSRCCSPLQALSALAAPRLAAPRARWSREPSLLPARTPSSPGGLKVKARACSAPSLRVRREAIG